MSVLGLFLPAYVSAGTIVNPHQYAWSNNVGYINFASTTVSDSALGGYAWSANKGFIKFNPAQGGVLNDGAGNLSGSAWGEGLGWIDFDGVSINGSTGKFSGTATGEVVGTITFDCHFCDVVTDWRQATAPTPTPAPVAVSSGGGGPIVQTPVPPPQIPTVPVQESALSAQAKHFDVLKDGKIDIIDFNAMMVSWGNTRNLAAAGSALDPADMNGDGVVDIFDFNTLMVYWGATYQL